jgi:hypothetical protein
VGRLGLSFRQNLDLSANDHVKRIAGIAAPEESFVRDETASTDATQKRLDFLRRQIPQEIAFRQEPDQFAQLVALTIPDIFAEPARIADSGSASFEKTGGHEVEAGAKGESPADEEPSASKVEAAQM